MTDEEADLIAEKIVGKLKGKLIEPEIFDLEQAGIFLGRTKGAVRMMINSGQIPRSVIRRIGGRVFLDRKNLKAWIAAN